MHDDEELLTFQRFMLAFDTPAYLRRARQVEAEWTHLLAHCERERERRLAMPKLRLAQLIHATNAVHHPDRLPLPAQDCDALLDLFHEWQPQVRSRVPAARTPVAIAALLNNVRGAFARFNRAWERFLNEVDLKPLNRAREGYNRYYVLEKECAVRSVKTAQDGFEPLPMATTEDLRRLFPQLP